MTMHCLKSTREEILSLVEEIVRGRRSGTLIFRRGDILKRLYFTDGTLVSFSSNAPEDALEAFLLSSAADLARRAAHWRGDYGAAALELEGLLVGSSSLVIQSMLVEAGIDSLDMESMLLTQMRAVVRSVLAASGGELSFEPTPSVWEIEAPAELWDSRPAAPAAPPMPAAAELEIDQLLWEASELLLDSAPADALCRCLMALSMAPQSVQARRVLEEALSRLEPVAA